MSDLARVQARCARLEDALSTLIAWMTQSTLSPITSQEAAQLLKTLSRSLEQEATR